MTSSSSSLSTFIAFMTLFGRTQQTLKDKMRGEIAESLGPLHLRALCLCQRCPGETQQHLVQAMGRDKGQIARLIRDLEALGWLVRTTDARDRRVWRLSVTPEGEARCRWFSGIEARLAADLFGGMDPGDLARVEQVLGEANTRLCRGTTPPE